jgi:site-specific recombinase XerD
MARSIYPDKEKQYPRELEKLKQETFSQRDKDLILMWHNHLFATGSQEARVQKISAQMRKIRNWLHVDFEKVSRIHIETVVAKINTDTSKSDATKSDYRRVIKQFYSWLIDEAEILSLKDDATTKLWKYIRKIKIKYKSKKIEYSEILTEKDLRRLLEYGCDNIRDKAFICMLHEGGFRVGEFLNIKIKDVEMTDSCIRVMVDGKTGKRIVPLYLSVGHFMRWVESHPLRSDKESYLWIGMNNRFLHKPLNRIGAVRIIEKVFKKALLKKRNNPHWFRHSRATINAVFMRQPILCNFMGWTQTSEQVATYYHGDVTQVEDAIMMQKGIIKQDAIEPQFLRCTTCNIINDGHAKFCNRCGRALSVEVAMQVTEHLNKAMEIQEAIGKNPELKKMFD